MCLPKMFALYLMFCFGIIGHSQVVTPTYYLSTPQQSQPQQISPGSYGTFSPSRQTKVIIHGWLGNYNMNPADTIAQAYTAQNNYNVISADWNQPAMTSYAEARQLVSSLGQEIANLLYGLTQQGAQLEDIHLIGHSLGAHVASNAAAYVNGNGRIGRITALDPSMQLFSSQSPDRLSSSNANLVDVIHTNAGQLGDVEVLGHSDFYPDGGTYQNGCSASDVANNGYCSHSRAGYYFAESITNPGNFIGVQCVDYNQYLQGQCSANTQIEMGENVPNNARGQYYLQVNPQPPYGRGV